MYPAGGSGSVRCRYGRGDCMFAVNCRTDIRRCLYGRGMRRREGRGGLIFNFFILLFNFVRGGEGRGGG